MPRFTPIIERGTSRVITHTYKQGEKSVQTIEREFSLNYFTRSRKKVNA